MIKWNEFEKVDWAFCPFCKGATLVEDGCDDYYEGCGYWCTDLECRSTFHMPRCDTLSPAEHTKKLEEIAENLTPTEEQQLEQARERFTHWD